MAKFHINGKGEPGKCSAAQGNCPFGSDEEHFTSAEAARDAYELQMSDEANGVIKKDKLPKLNELYKNSPRANIGISKTYGLLNGIQEDIDAGLISDSRARGRIAAVVKTLERDEEIFHSDPATEKGPNAKANRLEFIEKLRGLSGGTEATEPLKATQEWGDVYATVSKYSHSAELDKDRRNIARMLADNLNGQPFVYQGASNKRALELATKLRDSFAKARKPELVKLHSLLSEAIEKDGRAS